MKNTEKIKISNNKGQNISAVIHNPNTATDNIAILCPGYLDSKDYEHLVSLAERLSDIGYTAVRFDPTGTGESEGTTDDYLTSQYLKDIKSIIDYMLSKSNFKNILIAGHSRGGMVSIIYAAQDPRISQVVSIMSSSVKTIKGKRYKDWETVGYELSSRDVANTTEKREYKVPYAHVLDRQKFNVFEQVKNVHVPIILLAGELDTLVYPEEVKEIFDLANEPKKYFLIKGVGHDYRRNPDQIKIINDVIVENI